MLLVDLDGAKYDYPVAFLEEAFGGLAREFGVEPLKIALQVKSELDPDLISEIEELIERSSEVRNF